MRLATRHFLYTEFAVLNLKWTLEMVQFFLLRVTFEKARSMIHVGCHLLSQLDRSWNVETPAQVVRLSVMSRPGFELPTFLGGHWSHVFYFNFDPPIPKLLKLFVIPDPFKIFRICISWISSQKNWVGVCITCWQWFHGICFIFSCMTVLTFYDKTLKMNCAFTSLNGVAFQLPKLDFL